MSAYFTIGWSDRMRALFFGRVRHVHADPDPVVFRQKYHTGSGSLDSDAFGFHANGHWDARVFDGDRPYLTIVEPDSLRMMACPCCNQVVNIDRIHKPHPASIALWRQLKRMMPSAEVEP